MCRIIHGIPVVADASLSPEKIDKLVSELMQTCAWEGRELGKIEFISDGELIQIRAYDKPSITFIPVKSFS